METDLLVICKDSVGGGGVSYISHFIFKPLSALAGVFMSYIYCLLIL